MRLATLAIITLLTTPLQAGCATAKQVGQGYAGVASAYGHGLHQLVKGDVVFAAPAASTPPAGGYPVYRPSQCVGAVVNGICHGSVMGRPVAVCHGEMLNGQCTGPMF